MLQTNFGFRKESTTSFELLGVLQIWKYRYKQNGNIEWLPMGKNAFLPTKAKGKGYI